MSETEAGVLRVTKIVSDLRVFARQEKEGMELADLNKSLDCALNIVSSEVRYNTTVAKEYGVLPEVLCYPRQMEQVFINLLVNAVQSIDKKGTIVLRTFHRDSNVFIEIEDNGCGIPERDQQRIFDPFFTTKEAGQGTGLGLSIVYNVLQNHQGDVTVKSVVGKGSTFILRVPVKPVPQK
jgi:signal transduction histidine kinase